MNNGGIAGGDSLVRECFCLTAHAEPDDQARQAEEFERRGERAQYPAYEHAGQGHDESGLPSALVRVNRPGYRTKEHAFRSQEEKEGEEEEGGEGGRSDCRIGDVEQAKQGRKLHKASARTDNRGDETLSESSSSSLTPCARQRSKQSYHQR